jgi:cell division protein FtsA
MMGWAWGRSERLCAVLALGSHRIGCAIITCAGGASARDGAPRFEIHGFAASRSLGWTAGRIHNAMALERCIRRVVARAEAAAGLAVDRVAVVASFDALLSEGFRAGLPLAGQALTRRDIDIVFQAARDHAERGGRRALHLLAAGHDLSAGPDCYERSYLNVDFQALSVPGAMERGIAQCLRGCQLFAESVVAAPYASALAVTSPEDRDLGCVVLDLGANTSSAILFRDGVLDHLSVVPQGGAHITAGIARYFGLSRNLAEHVKLRHGSVFDLMAQDCEVPVSVGEDREPMFKSELNEVIRNGLIQLLETLKARLAAAGMLKRAGEPLIVTGGASALPGAAELAGQIFARPVRRGQIAALKGLGPDEHLSDLAGGCLHVAMDGGWDGRPALAGGEQKSSYAGRIGQWLRASF